MTRLYLGLRTGNPPDRFSSLTCPGLLTSTVLALRLPLAESYCDYISHALPADELLEGPEATGRSGEWKSSTIGCMDTSLQCF